MKAQPDAMLRVPVDRHPHCSVSAGGCRSSRPVTLTRATLEAAADGPLERKRSVKKGGERKNGGSGNEQRKRATKGRDGKRTRRSRVARDLYRDNSEAYLTEAAIQSVVEDRRLRLDWRPSSDVEDMLRKAQERNQANMIVGSSQPSTLDDRRAHRRGVSEEDCAALGALAGVEPSVFSSAAARVGPRVNPTELVQSSSDNFEGWDPPPLHPLSRLSNAQSFDEGLPAPVKQLLIHARGSELTRSQEIELVTLVQNSYALLEDGNEEEISLEHIPQEAAQEIVTLGQQAEALLRSACLRTVIKVALRYRWTGIDMTDLIGEGLLGFKNGLKKFDIKRGTRLTTFLYYWIFDAISKAYAQQRYIVSVPKKTQQQIIAVRKVVDSYWHKHTCYPSFNVLRAKMNMTEHALKRVLWASNLREIALESLLVNDNGDTITLCDSLKNNDNLSDEMDEQLQRVAVRQLVQKLPAKEQVVLQMIYGLHNGRPASSREVGKELQLTVQRINQLQRQALRRIQDEYGLELDDMMQNWASAVS